MSCKRGAATFVAAMIAAACVPAGASAKTLVGTGGDPHAVAAPDGTAHVVWSDDIGDTVTYCRVAPGTESCAATRTWTVGADPEADVLRDPGTGVVHVVVSVTGAGTAPFNGGTGLYDIRSSTADASSNAWATAAKITSNAAGTAIGNANNGAIFGPGAFQVTWMSSVGTGDNARLTFGSTTGGAEGGRSDLVPSSYEADIGLITQDRPLVVSRDIDDAKLYWRSFGAGNPRTDPWRPLKSLPANATGLEVDLASNAVAPPALITTEQVSGTDHRVTLRRYDDASDSFGAPTTVNDDDQTNDAWVFMDAASNVHAIMTTNTPRYVEGASTALVYTASQTGAAWPKYGLVLDRDTSVTAPALAAGADGTGVAAWTRSQGTGSGADDAVYLGRVGGPASPWPTDPPPAGAAPGGGAPAAPPIDPSCVKLGSLGIAKLLSTGCFKKTAGTKLTTRQPFLVNGVTVDPKGSTVTVDTGKRTLDAPGTATTIALGPIRLGTGALDWTFPASGTWTRPGGAIDLDKTGLGAELLGLKIVGDGSLTFTSGKSALSGYLRLPAPFTGVTARLDFRGDNFAGLHFDGLKSHIDTLGWGFHDLDLEYTSDPPTWTGALKFSPAVLEGKGTDFEGSFKIVDGALENLSVAAKFPAPGRELYPPLVYLRYAGLDLQPSPLQLTGKVVVSGGPSVGDTGAISVGRAFDDFGTIKLRLSDPFSLRADGPVYVLGTKLGAGYFEYLYPGDISFGANAKIGECDGGVAGAEAAVNGFVSVGGGFKMNAKGKGRACLGPASASATAVVSTKGIAACADFSVPPVSAGAGHYWGELGVHLMPVLCDTAPYEESKPAAQSAQAGGGRPIRVQSGLRQLNVMLTGAGGVPVATLVGPDGTRYPGQATGTVTTGAAMAVAEPALRRQTFLVARPKAGTWTVEPAPGSPAIAKVELARDAPPIRVTGRVRRTGRGAQRELAWKVASRSGQAVTLFEEGKGVLRRLGRATGASGTIRWTPKTLRGGTRRVTAMVERDGLAERSVTLARFTVPPPPRPGVARRLRATHEGSRLVVRWTPGARAVRQEVRVRLTNGIGQVFRVGRRVRTLRVPGVGRRITGTLTVVGLRADGATGRTARATVRAAKRRTARRRG